MENKIMRIMEAVGISALLCIGAGSMAAGFMPWTDVYMMADADHSGALTPAEVKHFSSSQVQGFAPWVSEHFSEMDTNQDNQLTMYEMKAYMMKMSMGDEEMSRGFWSGFKPYKSGAGR